MNPFDGMMNNIITLIKKDGNKIEAIKASVQKNKVFISGSDVLIEVGDLIENKLSNGAIDTYEVLDPGFHEKFHSIPAGYQMDVKKLGIKDAKDIIKNITYNISGDNNRINQNSMDHSVNIFNTNSDEILKLINELKTSIEKLDIDESEKNSAFEIIEVVDSQVKLNNPSKAVVSSLLKGLPAAANIATITSSILGLL